MSPEERFRAAWWTAESLLAIRRAASDRFADAIRGLIPPIGREIDMPALIDALNEYDAAVAREQDA